MVTGKKGTDPAIIANNIVRLKEISKNPYITFRSIAQTNAFTTLTEVRSDVIFVLPTGSGKSYLAIIASQLQPHKVTVYVTPFRALSDDLERRCTSMGIKSAHYHSTISPNWNGLMIVSAEEAVSDSFLPNINSLAEQDRINMIVIDECHSFLTQKHFRTSMEKVYRLAIHPKVRIIAMSATLKMNDTRLFSSLLNRTFHIQRVSADRKNIRFVLEKVPSFNQESTPYTPLINRMFEIIKEKKVHFKKEDRIIVYMPTPGLVQKVINAIKEEKIGTCDSWSKESLAAASVISWKANGLIMVATSGFGQGIDYASVRMVFVLGYCYSPHDYLQFGGRVGRDNQVGDYITLVNDYSLSALQYISQSADPYTKSNMTDMVRFLTGPTSKQQNIFDFDEYQEHIPICLRERSLYKFDISTYPCLSDSICEPCNMCENSLKSVGLQRLKDKKNGQVHICSSHVQFDDVRSDQPLTKPVAEDTVIERQQGLSPVEEVIPVLPVVEKRTVSDANHQIDKQVSKQKTGDPIDTGLKLIHIRNENVLCPPPKATHQKETPKSRLDVSNSQIILPEIQSSYEDITEAEIQKEKDRVQAPVKPVVQPVVQPIDQPVVQPPVKDSVEEKEIWETWSIYITEQLGDVCVPCVVVTGKRIKHHTTACKTVKGRCPHCFSLDHTNKCPDKPAVPNPIPSTVKGICVHCAFPYDLFDKLFPPSDLYGVTEKKHECPHYRSFNFLSFGMLLFQYRQLLKPFFASTFGVPENDLVLRDPKRFACHLVRWNSKRTASMGEILFGLYFKDKDLRLKVIKSQMFAQG